MSDIPEHPGIELEIRDDAGHGELEQTIRLTETVNGPTRIIDIPENAVVYGSSTEYDTEAWFFRDDFIDNWESAGESVGVGELFYWISVEEGVTTNA